MQACYNGGKHGGEEVSHAVSLPDPLYNRLAAVAAREGKSVDVLIEALLLRELEQAETPEAHGLEWATASADEIIAEIRASRVERPNSISG